MSRLYQDKNCRPECVRCLDCAHLNDFHDECKVRGAVVTASSWRVCGVFKKKRNKPRKEPKNED